MSLPRVLGLGCACVLQAIPDYIAKHAQPQDLCCVAAVIMCLSMCSVIQLTPYLLCSPMMTQ
jgi:hypothetical protein